MVEMTEIDYVCDDDRDQRSELLPDFNTLRLIGEQLGNLTVEEKTLTFAWIHTVSFI